MLHTTNLDPCEMTVVPGGLIITAGKQATYQILNDIQGVRSNALASYQANPLSIPIRLDASKSIILNSKPLLHHYDKHIRRFRSKNGALREFLQQDAFAFEELSNTCTTLFFDETTNQLVAYCAKKCASLKLQAQSIDSLCPSIEIAALCVDDRYRFKGIGETIINYVISQASQIRGIAGVQLITLFALPEAVGFYQRLNFRKIVGDMQILQAPAHKGCIPMYLPLPRPSVATKV